MIQQKLEFIKFKYYYKTYTIQEKINYFINLWIKNKFLELETRHKEI